MFAQRVLRSSAGAVAASLLVLATLASCSKESAPEPGKVLWRGDFETGDLSQWSGTECEPGGVDVIRDPVRQGTYAARFVVHPGDDPIDASGERCELREPIREEEGDESWWSWSTYFADVFDLNPENTWNIITQWHARSSGLGGPPVAFELGGGEGDGPDWPLELRVRGGDPSAPDEQNFELGRLRPGEWNDFLFHVKWSSNPSDGLVEVWLNGEQVVPSTPIATLFEGSGVYVKQGFYRGDAQVTATIVHDGLTRGTSRDAVEPKGDPPPLPSFEVASNLKPGEQLDGTVKWQARVRGAPAEEVSFFIDGRLAWTENEAPYCFKGDSCRWDVASVPPGDHELEVRAVASDGRDAVWRARVQTQASGG